MRAGEASRHAAFLISNEISVRSKLKTTPWALRKWHFSVLSGILKTNNLAIFKQIIVAALIVINISVFVYAGNPCKAVERTLVGPGCALKVE